MAKKRGKKKNTTLVLWILIVAVLVCLVGLAVGFMILQGKLPQLKPIQTTEPTATVETTTTLPADPHEAEMAALLDVDTVYPGVYVDGIALGGMTEAEAKAAIRKQMEENLKDIQVTVKLEKNVKTFTFRDMTLKDDLDEVVKEAMAVGREGDRETRFAYVQGLEADPVQLTTSVDVDPVTLEPKIRALAEAWRVDPVEPTVTGFDPEAKEKFTVTQPVAGRAVKADELWKLVMAELENKTYGTVEAPVEALEPEHTVEDILALNKLIVRFQSKMTNDSPRISNIKLACSAISGTVLQPGETFSFNGVVGKRTKARGYKEAGVIIGGMSDVGLGGGVCQVSGTLFNAAVRADLEIVSRKHHSYALSYLGPGTDATVDYDSNTDLKFKNTHDTPVFLHMYTDGLKVIAEVYGAPLENGMTIDLVVDILEKTKPDSEPVTVMDKSVPVGEYKKTSGHTGYKLNAYRVYYDADGNEIKRVLEHSDTYKVIQPKILVNPKTTTPTPTPAPTPTPPPTEPATEPPTEPATEPPTEPSTEPPTEPTEETED